jgi:5S rRNA maturation endonuclease (ribonuclease M5)
MDYEKSLNDLEKILIDLREKNNEIPILVEGEKDIEALKKLNIKGIIFSLNKGMSLTNFCDLISKKYNKIILLTDWDKKGGQLCYKLKKNLLGRVDCITDYRKKIAQKTTIKTVEGLPSWIETINKNIQINISKKY